jgi:hypothetical protein
MREASFFCRLREPQSTKKTQSTYLLTKRKALTDPELPGLEVYMNQNIF